MKYLIRIEGKDRQYVYTVRPHITTTNVRKYAKPFDTRPAARIALSAIQYQWKLEGWSMGTLSIVRQ